MINFNYENVIICLYPGGSGGKFLVNNLGLSDSALFQHLELSLFQIKGKFNKSKKINFLLNKISNIKDIWTDLDLDDVHFFGAFSEEIDYCSEEEYKEKLNLKSSFIEKFIENKKYFFVLSHNYETFLKQKKIWKNSKTIIFTDHFFFTLLRNCKSNFRTFIWDRVLEKTDLYLPPYIPPMGNINMDIFGDIGEEAKKFVKETLSDKKFIDECKEKYEKMKLKNIWKIVRKEHWEIESPKSIHEYLKLPHDIREEIQELFEEIKYTYGPKLNYPKNNFDNFDYKWNVNWYFSEEETCFHIKELYDKLGFDDYDDEYTRKYYKTWFSKINEMSRISHE
jgi:hypothetical protein